MDQDEIDREVRRQVNDEIAQENVIRISQGIAMSADQLLQEIVNDTDRSHLARNVELLFLESQILGNSARAGMMIYGPRPLRRIHIDAKKPTALAVNVNVRHREPRQEERDMNLVQPQIEARRLGLEEGEMPPEPPPPIEPRAVEVEEILDDLEFKRRSVPDIADSPDPIADAIRAMCGEDDEEDAG